jgi:hypothetical protein
MTPVLISSNGSDRATGYNMSSKLIRTSDTLFAGWLDAPSASGDTAKVQFAAFDPQTGDHRSTQILGEGIDNHCGPALAMDPDGRMHALIGAHHGPLLYRWSDGPAEAGSWSAPEPLGPDDTYPSLAIDTEGTLHLAHREKADRWQLWYRRKRRNQEWESPVSIAISPTPGYNHYMMSLTVGPTGTLHLVFQFHFAESGRAEDCKCRAAVYLRSYDSGDTWLDDGDEIAHLPVTMESMTPIRYVPDGGDDQHAVRVANNVVDGQDRAWFFASIQDAEHGIVFRRDPGGWKEFDLSRMTGGLNVEGGRASSITRSADGRIHLALATNPQGLRTKWYDPSLSLFHTSFNEEGEDHRIKAVTVPDSEAANWLPALEHWDWNRTNICCQDGHWMMYTRGLNAGGIGGDNKSPLKTEVYLTKVSP